MSNEFGNPTGYAAPTEQEAQAVNTSQFLQETQPAQARSAVPVPRTSAGRLLPLPPQLQLLQALRAALGGFAAILLCAALGSASQLALLMAPLGATCVLAFALPDSPLAQPRNIVGGHLLSTAIGLLTLSCFGSHPWSLALGVALAIAAMQLTRTVHPPAGADPLLVMLSGAGWSFLLTPVLAGTVLIVAIAWLYHRLAPVAPAAPAAPVARATPSTPATSGPPATPIPSPAPTAAATPAALRPRYPKKWW